MFRKIWSKKSRQEEEARELPEEKVQGEKKPLTAAERALERYREQVRQQKLEDQERVRAPSMKIKPEEEEEEKENDLVREVKKEKKPSGFKLGRKHIVMIVIAVVVILFLGVMAFFLLPKVSMVPTADPNVGGGLVVTPIPSTITQVPSVDWSQSSLAAIKPQEQSPMINKVFQPKDSVLMVLLFVLVLTLFSNIGLDWREGGEGNEEWWEKTLVGLQSASCLIAGLLFPWVFSFTYRDGLFFFISVVFFTVFMTLSAARAIKDGTSLNTAFVLLAGSLAVRGVSEFPIGVANVAGWADKTPWVGFYSWSGLLTLIVSLRTAEAGLTVVIYLLLLAALLISTVEALKKYQASEAVVAVMFVIGSVAIGNYLSALLFSFMKPTTMDVVIAFEIAKPVLGWVLGVLGAIAGSLFLKGKEFKLRGITMQMAQVSGAQSIVNFIALMTTLSIVANLVWR